MSSPICLPNNTKWDSTCVLGLENAHHEAIHEWCRVVRRENRQTVSLVYIQNRENLRKFEERLIVPRSGMAKL